MLTCNNRTLLAGVQIFRGPKKNVSVLFLVVGVVGGGRRGTTLSFTQRLHGSDVFAAAESVLVALLFLVLFLLTASLGVVHFEVLSTGSSVVSEKGYLVT